MATLGSRADGPVPRRLTADRAALLRRATEAFRERHGVRPAGVAFAPGRVNLIGEHVDYCQLPVLPFALSRGIAMAFHPRSDRMIQCGNERAEFEKVRFAPGDPVTGWGRYPAAAARAVGGDTGFDGMVVSNLPIASGLSSSSALVVATALALLRVNNREASLPELALELAAAERGVAIAGGAMDQSVALGARAGHALRIDFHRPRWRWIPVDPRPFRFLAAFSGERAAKGGPVGRIFDRRVREATTAIARVRDMPADGGGFGPDYPLPFAETSPETLRRAARGLPPPLDRRFLHLVNEAERTGDAGRALAEGDAPALGRILNDAHRSLRHDFEVSTPALDDLTRAALDAGALGARLTGAGFGGSAVILAEPDSFAGIRDRLRTAFYEPRGIPVETSLIDATPADGASVFTVPSPDLDATKASM